MTDETTEQGENWQARAELAEAALMRSRAEMDEKLVRAELKAEAIKAGMIDLDGLKLIDMSKIQLNESGEVSDGGAVLVKLKQAKPWLFGAGRSSSAAVSAPRPEPPRMRHANELTHDEWQAARAALLRRR